MSYMRADSQPLERLSRSNYIFHLNASVVGSTLRELILFQKRIEVPDYAASAGPTRQLLHMRTYFPKSYAS